ncbi:hypothetical protein ACFQ3P_43370 [Paraburkholderia sabiae]|uniref:Uncharacterized protein n=1 Tax=Paraburkholderia sabiae TaxID=273251 RepID=A0ABU9QSW7_9BURK|nr:hypothetical protein [Paraburkholderia sabiae]WJZ80003.1 hypothetical protein QEN71_43440 [Paraburkholderia sabiae]CAD6563378.1 hypothetical protein LMG24235_08622 [Paraburkholderia sabiae]
MKYLAFALVLGIIVFGYMFRYDYQGGGMIRVNRWSGERQEFCPLPGGSIWTIDCLHAFRGY